MSTVTSLEVRRRYNSMMSVRSEFFDMCEKSDHGVTGWVFGDATAAGMTAKEVFMIFLQSTSSGEFEEMVFAELAERDLCPPLWASTSAGDHNRSRLADILQTYEG
jgi:hypothetical protein